MKKVNTININEIREDCKVGDRFIWLGFGNANMNKDVTIEITYVSREKDYLFIVGTVVKKDGTLGKMRTSWEKLYSHAWENSNRDNRNHGLFERE